MQDKELDIDIHLPSNEQLPVTLYRRFDQLLKHVNPLVAASLTVLTALAFQGLGAVLRSGSRLMWWAVLLIFLAAVFSRLLPGKYRPLYLLVLAVSIGVGLLWN